MAPRAGAEKIDHLNEPVLLVAGDRVAHANAAFARLVGGEAVQLTGLALSELFPDGDPAATPFTSTPARLRSGEHAIAVSVTSSPLEADRMLVVRPAGHEQQLAAALARVGLAIQSARTEEAIFAALVRGLLPLAIRPNLFRLCGEDLIELVSVSEKGPLGIRDAVEERLGHDVAGLRGKVSAHPPLARCLAAREVVFEPTVAAFLLSGETRRATEALLAGLNGIFTPLVVNDAPFGALLFVSPGRTPEDIPAFSLLAGQVAAALETARLIVELEERNRELAILNSVSRETAVLDPKGLLQLAADTLVRELSCEAAYIRVRGPEGASIPAHSGFDDETLAQARARMTDDNPIVMRVEKERRAVAWDLSAVGRPAAETVERGWRHLAVAPLLGKERLVGELVLMRRRNEPFGKRLLLLLQSIASELALSLENAHLFAQEKRRVTELSLVNEVSRTLTGSLELAVVLEAACESMRRIVDASQVSVLLPDQGRKVLCAAARTASMQIDLAELRFPVDGGSLSARCFRAREPLQVSDTSQADGFDPDIVRRTGEKALLALPLVARDVCIGVAVIGDTRGPRRFSDEEISRATGIANQVSVALQNARLYDELRQSYADLARTQTELVRRERLAALGELSAVVAHEVRNPLGVIFNSVTSVRRMVASHLTDDASMLLDIIHEEADRLNRIVGDLLDFARPIEASLSPADVGRVIEDAVASALAGGPHVRPHIEVDDRLPAVRMDVRLVRQALINLVSNAVHAMPRGGTVRIGAGRTATAHGDTCRIAVSDEGHGIPPEVSGRIFEPFFTTKATGTGLGLAVVKRIIEQHGGRVSVESTVGKGTTFVVDLPLDGSAA